MKIALFLEPSQYSKNNIFANIIQDVLKSLSTKHEFYNMINPSEKFLTSIHLGIRATLLLKAKAMDLFITGSTTGYGISYYLNLFPGVISDVILNPNDAKNHKGNVISLAFDKGCGLGWELKFKDILLNIFDEYNQEEEEEEEEEEEKQSKNIETIQHIKSAVAKDNYIDFLESLSYKLLYKAIHSENFVKCYFANSNNIDLDMYILNKLNINRNNQLLY